VGAAAVCFPPKFTRLNGLRDSKVLPEKRRHILARRVRERALYLGVGAASCREIDRFNIRVATAMAMRRAIRGVCRMAGGAPCHEPPPGLPREFVILVDGLPMREIGYPHEALVDGDALCDSIAAAAVIAKTVRDTLMRRLAARYPRYGWETNVGYGTPEHCAALGELGPTCHHRHSFEPIAQLALPL
jgi:ribonuclease HII